MEETGDYHDASSRGETLADSMGRKSKLRTYRTVKDKLVFEPYLNFDSRHARILLTRLRSGTNSLRIERGRWCNKVEDERHFLVECALYKDVRTMP